MTRLHIVCKAPPQPARDQSGRFPLVNGLVPGWHECSFFIVQDDGTEIELDNVQAASWSMEAGPECSEATLRLVNVSVDLVGKIDGGDVGYRTGLQHAAALLRSVADETWARNAGEAAVYESAANRVLGMSKP